MFYRDIESLSDAKFKRLTGVKRAVFELVLEVIAASRASTHKHPTRGTPPRLSNADKLMMYYREYRTMFHTGATYGISESRVCEVIRKFEGILIQDSRFHLTGKKSLIKGGVAVEVVLVDVTERPIERPKKTAAELFR